MDDFDFIKAFADVEILQVEAVGQVVGRVMGKIYLGMIDAGLSEQTATKIIIGAWGEFFSSTLGKAPS
jgi:hypothetical protein